MHPTKFIWYNDKFVPWADATTHVLTHSLHYGGSAFEGIRFYKTDKGPAIFRLAEHVDRLFYSANALKMSMPYTKDELINIIKELVRKNELEEGYIRPIVFYGYKKLGVNPVGSPVECAIACWSWKAYLPYECVDIKTSQYIRIHPKSSVIDAKLSGHYVNGILASLELQGTHYHEALFLDNDGYISEGVGENFFMVKDNVIYTPQLGTILNGITRDTVMKIAQQLKFKVIETNITLEEAYHADEAFFTGTAAEVTPICSIDDHRMKADPQYPVALQIKRAYAEVVHGKNPAFAESLTYIT